MVLDYCQPLPRLRSTVDVPLNSELLLPLLPLDDRVILPHMTVPVAVDSESARAAVLAARQTDGLVVLVPRIDGRFARLGTVVLDIRVVVEIFLHCFLAAGVEDLYDE